MDYQENMYTARRGKAADFRRIAKQALKGFWLIAALATLLASICGGIAMGGSVSFSGSGFNFEMNGVNNPDYTDPDSGSVGIIGGGEESAPDLPTFTEDEVTAFEEALADLDFGTMGEIVREEYPLLGFIFTFFVAIAIFATLGAFLLSMFVSSPVMVGYQKFCLNVHDGKKDDVTLGTVFEFFTHDYLKTVKLNFLHSLIMGLTMIPMYAGLIIGVVQLAATLPTLLTAADATTAIVSIFTFLGATYLGAIISLCISIPVTYMYSMAHMIMADYPGVGALEALRTSRQMMKGNKFRLFCLELSFIGWEFLAICCTCGIGMYFVTPYKYVARAAFYHEISNRSAANDVEFPSINPADYTIE